MLLCTFRPVDWCGCSPYAIADESFEKLQDAIKKSEKLFLARKFDASLSLTPINSLEDSFGPNKDSSLSGDLIMKIVVRLKNFSRLVQLLVEQLSSDIR